MSTFVPTKHNLREALLFCFNLKKSAADGHRLLCEAYGEHAPSIKTCEYWFRRFKSGDFDTSDKKREGRPVMFEDAELEALLDQDSCQTQEELAETLQLSRALKLKRPQYAKRHDKVIFQHDNARPHVAKVVKNTLEALQWDVLPHPPYSPDIAPSDYHLFRSMTHGLAEQHFTSYEEAKNWVDSWIASKDKKFFQRGIRMLPERWGKVVANDGQYFE